MSAIRLIAIDIDGTLLDDRKDIPPANVRAVRAALDAGIHVAIASGRMIPSLEAMERRLGIDCALIAYNGGKVVGSAASGRPLIAHTPMPDATARTVLEFARREGHLLNVCVDDVLYADRFHAESPLARLYHERTGSPYNFVDGGAIDDVVSRRPTKMILLAEPAEIERLHARFSVELDGRASVVITEREYLEFMSPGVDKSAALPLLARHHGVGIEHVMAIGDADNDRLMVRDAGVGVAVANARPGVLEVADHVTERTNNEGAVAEAIARWVLDDERVDFWRQEE